MKAKILQTTYQLEIMNKPSVLIGNLNVNKVQWKMAIDFLEGKTNSVSDDVLAIITELMHPSETVFNHDAYVERVPKLPTLLTTIEQAKTFNEVNGITNRTPEETLIIQAKNNPERKTFRLRVRGTQQGWEVFEVEYDAPVERTKLSWKTACLVEQGITKKEFAELKQALYCNQ